VIPRGAISSGNYSSGSTSADLEMTAREEHHDVF
jgi:hypothetical protein